MLVIMSCTIHSPAGKRVPEILLCVLLGKKQKSLWKKKREGKWKEKKVPESVTGFFVLVQNKFPSASR